MKQSPQPEFDEKKWFHLFKNKARVLYPNSDPAHDFLHIQRVVNTAKTLCDSEKGRWEVVMPAAFFHDFINVPKGDPRRPYASALSGEATIEYLKSIHYPEEFFEDIRHAIEAHSYSANIKPTTLEAKIVQDADRLDSLGAIGIARCFATTTLMSRPFYAEEDPWAEQRDLDDKNFGIDHFYMKLFKLVDLMNTETAKKEAQHRVTFIKEYLAQIKREI
ncbi:HD domain-containing protein [Bdellovibrio sp. SKB1291214]|uniref:HD domain-containing protein n=1 Tax=Bdellovibrio sp. SKB1291214 TaxID=1732569 RepID=UPI000B516D77|nr:HD domain-containing protein [Bdellovibrio sp. SKB1291214]UYL09268.1 HD domain-containing protein [Bdellovibrio sp. SKB1291214]